ncbi:MAG: DUF72 domain-containing protein [Calditrichaceae bacterium]|nr:DUF72 domain-containing protein [Calditrichaceae bacterium]MBN2710244.1 DUF72 domain-containing protein [Calditrichaceae bacterium]RQV93868.1 MAG: DUF72 domain-containing protein [Calditrichota bacterium]
MKRQTLYLGTSGWSYKDWQGPFYPQEMNSKNYLNHYAMHFDAVEIDSTFYGIPRRSTVENWRDQTPAHFIFSPKVPQMITHEKRLDNCEAEWKQFIAHMQILGDKLGPVVLQFDYQFTFKDHFEMLSRFLKQYSADCRLCVEIRNRDWHNEAFYKLLKDHQTALVLNDLYYMPRVQRITAGFTYIRLLGNRRQIPDDFSHIRIDRDKDLDWWATLIDECLEKELEVYAYSNNRYQGHAPATIRMLAERLKSPRNE